MYSYISIKVHDAIRKKWRNEFKRKEVLFHQDNAWLHVKIMTGWTLKWDSIQYPPNSPNMAISDLFFTSVAASKLRKLEFKWRCHKWGWFLSGLAHAKIFHIRDWRVAIRLADNYRFERRLLSSLALMISYAFITLQ